MKTSAGFTLLELLVVMAIVSILSAIAIPQFSAYRKRSFDMRATQDLHTIAIGEEAYFMDSEHYVSCANETCSLLPGVATLSKGVSLAVVATEESFVATATHASGTGKIFTWDSDHGGLQE